ncbi:MAG: anhydro-N-acetylmuramic acid kinase [Alphaproteobacteria bacterium]
MCARKVYRAIGLMSGTVLDGEIDVALLETDGYGFVRPLRYMAYPYDYEVREAVRACFGKIEPDEQTRIAEELVTRAHVEAVQALGEKVDVIGFHGQTITHNPQARFTWQLGDGARLAKETGIDCVYDMRKADVLAGGQGAPLLPLYHRALLEEHEKPVAVLNIGGVANLTYIGSDDPADIMAFDTGPGNAMMDDFMRLRTGFPYDRDGVLASRGRVVEHVVEKFMKHAYFSKTPPKSLDRNQWSIDCVRYTSDEDGMATLLEMSVRSIIRAVKSLPRPPEVIYAAGGGRHNSYLMGLLASSLSMEVVSIDALGWNGDATEAEGFAYLAVRSLLGEVLSLPTTTGVPQAISGGVLAEAK